VPRHQRALIARGDIWDATIPGGGTHPVAIVTRDTALPLLSSAVCALVTSTFHGHVAEVEVRPREGLDHDSAVNCDNLFTLPLNVLVKRRGRLGTAKLTQLDRALVVALGLD
jgi:mRNA-degrading endonuclease toxin of MazEF toxin-antitoxin module